MKPGLEPTKHSIGRNPSPFGTLASPHDILAQSLDSTRLAAVGTCSIESRTLLPQGFLQVIQIKNAADN